MSAPNVDRWRPSGTIVMWVTRWGSDRPWNIAASDSACDALIELFGLMEDAKWSSKKTLQLDKPVQTPDHGDRFPIRSAIELTIKYPREQVSETHWQIDEEDRKLLLTLGLSRLQELRDAVKDMRQGGGDYRIGSEEQPLWIWWWIKDFIVDNA